MQDPHTLLPLSREEKLEIYREHHDDLIRLSLTVTLPAMKETLAMLHEVRPARQLQCASMDVESLVAHLTELLEHGPARPFADIPLEASETTDTSVPEGWTDSTPVTPGEIQ